MKSNHVEFTRTNGDRCCISGGVPYSITEQDKKTTIILPDTQTVWNVKEDYETVKQTLEALNK